MRKKIGLPKKKKSQLREWVEAIVFALLVVLFIKSFLFDIYIVPSTSMENAIKAGDIVVVNKMKYGPRLPITPLSIPFSPQHLFNSSIKSFSNIIQLPYVRIPGYGVIKRNDVLVFNYPIEYYFPIDHKTPYVKRCVALPGDTLRIINKKVFVNGNELADSSTVKKIHEVKASAELEDALFEYFEWFEGGKTLEENTYRLYLTDEMKDSLLNRKEVKSVRPVAKPMGKAEGFLFDTSDEQNWNKDFYGPLYVPKKGDSLPLTPENVQNWLDVILRYETPHFEMVDSVFFVDGVAANYYHFKNNYYFVMGDNRDNSADSRFWGFVPESHIMGTASLTLFSINQRTSKWYNKVRWDRLLKPIH